MASIRNLKKDVEYLVFEVVSDCYAHEEVRPGKHSAELTDIIEDAVQLRNDLYRRINGESATVEPADRKKLFSAIRKDLFSGIDNLFDRLSKLTKN
ncbi:MAG: hypothetical protein RBS37_05115 [Bacteroidales bacterium]|jgi:hypothetical protein|nr:hypothetical protein [Bacteroidales bacterium]